MRSPAMASPATKRATEDAAREDETCAMYRDSWKNHADGERLGFAVIGVAAIGLGGARDTRPDLSVKPVRISRLSDRRTTDIIGR